MLIYLFLFTVNFVVKLFYNKNTIVILNLNNFKFRLFSKILKYIIYDRLDVSSQKKNNLNPSSLLNYNTN